MIFLFENYQLSVLRFLINYPSSQTSLLCFSLFFATQGKLCQLQPMPKAKSVSQINTLEFPFYLSFTAVP